MVVAGGWRSGWSGWGGGDLTELRRVCHRALSLLNQTGPACASTLPRTHAATRWRRRARTSSTPTTPTASTARATWRRPTQVQRSSHGACVAGSVSAQAVASDLCCLMACVFAAAAVRVQQLLRGSWDAASLRSTSARPLTGPPLASACNVLSAPPQCTSWNTTGERACLLASSGVHEHAPGHG